MSSPSASSLLSGSARPGPVAARGGTLTRCGWLAAARSCGWALRPGLPRLRAAKQRGLDGRRESGMPAEEREQVAPAHDQELLHDDGRSQHRVVEDQAAREE